MLPSTANAPKDLGRFWATLNHPGFSLATFGFSFIFRSRKVRLATFIDHCNACDNMTWRPCCSSIEELQDRQSAQMTHCSDHFGLASLLPHMH